MGLIRITLYIFCGVMIWHIGKRLFRSMTQTTEEETQTTKEGSVPSQVQKCGPVVRCAHCGLHIPKQEALNRNEVFFCCEAHRKAFIEHHK